MLSVQYVSVTTAVDVFVVYLPFLSGSLPGGDMSPNFISFLNCSLYNLALGRRETDGTMYVGRVCNEESEKGRKLINIRENQGNGNNFVYGWNLSNSGPEESVLFREVLRSALTEGLHCIGTCSCTLQCYIHVDNC